MGASVLRSILTCGILLGAVTSWASGTAVGKALPNVSLTGTDGKTYNAAALAARPTVLVFINHRCGHSKDAIPSVNRLAAGLGSGARLIGVANVGRAEAVEMRSRLKANFPILADPDLKLIEAFGATHSMDVGVVRPQGRLMVRRWNEFSQASVTGVIELLRTMGVRNIRVGGADFRGVSHSGCSF